tara:strand:- start:992 stop:1294 length:303 start_codon:yes stop_codon:yes gene_type:complete
MTNYNDGTGRWHSEYIAKTKRMTDAELDYVSKDCRAAYEANPEGPKGEQYADEILYCNQEIHRRELRAGDAERRRRFRELDTKRRSFDYDADESPYWGYS